MPLGAGVRYRTVGKGKSRVRYAYRGNSLLEVKHFKSGETHKITRDEREKSIHTYARRGRRK
jgi:hypothetical protein